MPSLSKPKNEVRVREPGSELEGVVIGYNLLIPFQGNRKMTRDIHMMDPSTMDLEEGDQGRGKQKEIKSFSNSLLSSSTISPGGAHTGRCYIPKTNRVEEKLEVRVQGVRENVLTLGLRGTHGQVKIPSQD